MFRFILLLFFPLTALSSPEGELESCVKNISNHYMDANAAYLSNVEEGLLESDPLITRATYLVKKSLLQQGCSHTVVDALDVIDVECASLVTDVCCINTPIGFFYVTFDYVQGAHVIWNRWD